MCNNGGEREKELYGKNGEEALFIGATKMWPLGAKRASPASPAWGRPAAGQADRESFPTIEPCKAAQQPAGEPAWSRPWAGLARSWAGQQPEPAGLVPARAGQAARAGPAGYPKVPASSRPGAGPAGQSGLFFSFLFLNSVKKTSETENTISFTHELRFR